MELREMFDEREQEIEGREAVVDLRKLECSRMREMELPAMERGRLEVMEMFEKMRAVLVLVTEIGLVEVWPMTRSGRTDEKERDEPLH
jgi:hypothetical protein